MDLFDNPSTSSTNDNPLNIGNDSERKRPLEYPPMTDNEEAKRKKTDNDDTDKPKKEVKNSDDMIMEEEKEAFALSVSNIPFQWTYEQISEYIQEHCIEVYALEQLEGGSLESGQTVRLMFLNFENCNQARKQLKLKSLEGRKLQVVFSVPEDSDSDIDTNKTLLVKRSLGSCSRVPSPWKPVTDVWAPDPSGMYGLKPDYLESLAIAPPLDKWVHVSNFRCDKSELREVMELAGHVVFCAVVTISNRYARVMYGHPLEAVQAVSMLNGQIFYGQVLKVSMYKCLNNEIILPKGLPKIGPGLGLNGRPLRDIVRQYERYLCGRYSCVNASIFVDAFSTTSNNGNIDNLTEMDNGTSTSNEKQSSIDPHKSYDPPTKKFEQIDKFVESRQNGSSSSQIIHHQQFNTTVVPNSAAVRPNLSWAPTLTPVSQSFQNKPNHLQNDSYVPGQGNSDRYGIPDQHSVHCGPLPYVGGQNVDYSMMGGHVPRMPHPCHVHITPRNIAYNHTPLVYNPYHVRSQAPVLNPVLSNSSGWGNPSPNMGNTAPSRVTDGERSVHGAGDQHKSTAFSAVELSNLPLSTTFPLLSEKMAQVGQVMSLELTKPGCAVVRFANTEHAERCYQHFNKMCVMGNIIDVKFI